MANVVDITLKIQNEGGKETEVSLKKLADQVDKVGNETKKSEKKVSKFQKTLLATRVAAQATGRALKGISSTSFNGLASASTAMAGVATATLALTSAMISYNRELEKQATLSGLTVEQFQEMSFAASLAGATTDEFADAVNNLNLKINEATILNGGAAIDVFKNLNLDVKELQRLDPAAQFEKVGEALAGADEAARRLFSDEIGSDALIQLLPFFDGYEKFTKIAKSFKEDGGFTTEEDIQRLKELDIYFKLLTQQIITTGSKFSGVFGQVVAKEIEQIIGNLQELATSTEDNFSKLEIYATRLGGIFNLISSALTLFLTGLDTSLNLVTQIFKNVNNNLDVLKKVLTGDFDAINLWEDTFDLSGLREANKTIKSETDDIFEALNSIVFAEEDLLKRNLDGITSVMTAFINDFKNITAELEGTDIINQDDYVSIYNSIVKSQNELAENSKKLQRQLAINPDDEGLKELAKSYEDALVVAENALKEILTFGGEKGFKITLSDQSAVSAVDNMVGVLQQKLLEELTDIELTKLNFKAGNINADEFKAQLEKEIQEAIDFINDKILNNEGIKLTTADRDSFEKQLLNLQIQQKNIAKETEKQAEASKKVDTFTRDVLNNEIEILKLKGQETKAEELITAEKIEQIKAQDNLTAQQKNKLIEQIEEINKLKEVNNELDLRLQKMEEIEARIASGNSFTENGENLRLLEEERQAILDIEEAEGLRADASIKATQIVNEGVEANKEAYNDLASSLADGATSALMSWINGTKSIEDAFADMLLNIAASIIESNINQLLTDMFSGIFSGAGGEGGFINAIANGISGSFLHSGGVVGKDGFSRNASFTPAQLSTLPRYHTGGIAGLRPNEVPAVLEQGEEVLTRDDPRHINNGGGNTGGSTSIVNLFDPDQMSQALEGNATFKNTIKNIITADKNEYNSIINSG